MSNSVVCKFEEWMRSVGISWNSEAIKIVAQDGIVLCSGLALGVLAAKDIKDGDHLCRIPKSACLRPCNCSISDVLQEEGLFSGGLGLVVATMHEASLGRDSKWAGYFESMPCREYVPHFWSESELDQLTGTALGGGAIARDVANLLDDYETEVVPLLHKYPDRFIVNNCTFDHFKNAASLVASRMFGIDAQGAGLVPLADVFNHKCSVVELSGEYEVAEEDYERHESRDGEESDEKEEFSNCAHTPHNHHHHSNSPQKHISKPHIQNPQTTKEGGLQSWPSYLGITRANGMHLHLEIGIIDANEDDLEIVAACDVPAGQEIHNTYGELGNAELVKRYGFALMENPFSTVQLDKGMVIEACRALYNTERNIKHPTRKRARKTTNNKNVSVFDGLLSLLSTETNLLSMDDTNEENDRDDDHFAPFEPFELLPNGHINPSLYIALRVLCWGVDYVSENDSHVPPNLKEALGGDTDRAYRVFVEPEAPQGSKEEEEEEEEIDAVHIYAHTCDCSRNDKNEIESLQSFLVTESMRTVLKSVAVQRRAQYRHTDINQQAATLQAMEESLFLHTSNTIKLITESHAALRAALTLAVSEQNILQVFC